MQPASGIFRAPCCNQLAILSNWTTFVNAWNSVQQGEPYSKAHCQTADASEREGAGWRSATAALEGASAALPGSLSARGRHILANHASQRHCGRLGRASAALRTSPRTGKPSCTPGDLVAAV